MRNVILVNSTNFNDIVAKIPKCGANFTNGTYAFPIEKIQETTLTGFEFVNSLNDLPMVIAINSDDSMRALKKIGFEDQYERAMKIAEPLTDRFQIRQLIIIFYDQETPEKLYQALNQHGLTKTLHKWGYGIDPKAPKIEGAEYFDAVYSFPLPDGSKPNCYDETALQTEPQKIQVVDLRSRLSSNASNTVVAHSSQSSAVTSQRASKENAKKFITENKHTLFAAETATEVRACEEVQKTVTKSPGQN